MADFRVVVFGEHDGAPEGVETVLPIGALDERADLVVEALRRLPYPLALDLAIGAGVGGWAAQLVALGGRSRALALVDGLPEMFARAGEVVAERFAHMRRRLEGSLEPAGYLVGPTFAERAAAALNVPVLVIETPLSLSSPDVVERFLGACHGAALHRVVSRMEAHALALEWMVAAVRR